MKALEFFREAEYLAAEHPELNNKIYSGQTVETVILNMAKELRRDVSKEKF